MNQEASVATAAVSSTELALERTRMASERTLMAWIRTSLSMISFGFTILKFFQFLKQSQGPSGHFQGVRAYHLGLILITIGTLILIPVVVQNYRLMKKLSVQDKGQVWSLSLIVAIIVGGLGLFAFLSSIFDWRF
jgi:putative membrane protein